MQDAGVVTKSMRLHHNHNKLQERTIYKYRDDSSPETLKHRRMRKRVITSNIQAPIVQTLVS